MEAFGGKVPRYTDFGKNKKKTKKRVSQRRATVGPIPRVATDHRQKIQQVANPGGWEFFFVHGEFFLSPRKDRSIDRKVDRSLDR